VFIIDLGGICNYATEIILAHVILETCNIVKLARNRNQSINGSRRGDSPIYIAVWID